MNKDLTKLPSIDLLLSRKKAAALCESYSREIIKSRCHQSLAEIRSAILAGGDISTMTREELVERILESVERRLFLDLQPSLRRVINATGIILHTGLGRAPFSDQAQLNINKVIKGYSNLEIDLESGKRGQRTDHIEKMLCELTGAEAALVVNNNAAAVFLTLNTLAFGREAVISRGQLVEIGGSFRIPEVMEKSGCLMKEIGTTNKTKLSDYKKAITENTGVVVVAHTSNYRVLGFTAQVALKDVGDLCAQKKVPLIHDLGAGVLTDLRQFGLPYEPLVQDSIQSGADVITFSGDKVMGGPQSGLIVGKKKYLQQIHNNPIMRAVRCDKMVYAALEATLKLYFRKKTLPVQNRTLYMLSQPEKALEEKCQRVITKTKSGAVSAKMVKSSAQAGSGTLPLEQIASRALVLRSDTLSAERLARSFRNNDPPVMGYVKNEEFYLDVRTVLDDEIDLLAEAINRIGSIG